MSQAPRNGLSYRDAGVDPGRAQDLVTRIRRIADRTPREGVVAGIGRGCELAGAALVGGETAEMPGMYADGDYDLAGFCVGIVERAGIVDGTRVRPGDRVVAIASSGPHSNGYSLIRRVLEASGTSLDLCIGGMRLADALLAPTRIYAASVLPIIRGGHVHAVAHVTGGGIVENLPRVLPPGTRATIDATSWRRPEIFTWLGNTGGIAEDEMWRTFNCGAGMLLVTAPDAAAAVVGGLEANGERAWVAGRIREGGDVPDLRFE